MKQSTLNQWTITDSQDTFLLAWMEAFLFDRKAQGLSKGTLYFYQKKLLKFTQFCESQAIKHIPELNSTNLREYLVWLEQLGHNKGGIHACYRALKTFMLWWEDEVESDDWNNPIRKVKAPRLPKEMIQPVKIETIQSMLATCDSTLLGKRDKAILLCLLDTGTRAEEFCSMSLEDLDKVYGSIVIKNGKGIRKEGKNIGNWLSKKQAQDLLNKPDISSLKGLRDRAVLAVFIGCGLRRHETSTLRIDQLQQREGRWVIIDMVGKRNKVRSVPMPNWCKAAIDEWLLNANFIAGYICLCN